MGIVSSVETYMGEMNVLAFTKEEDSYIFIYKDGQSDELFATFKRYADEPTLNFSDTDAEMLADKVTTIREKYLAIYQQMYRKLFNR